MFTPRSLPGQTVSRMKRVAASVCAVSTMWSATVPAIAAIANTPLYLTAAVEPNVLFMLDDSGSMHWEITPDDYVYSYYLYPRAAGNYGGADYTNFVVSFRDDASAANDAERATARALRSAQVNKTYYNPAVTYTPWAKPAGMAFPGAVPAVNAAASSFPNANPAAAPNHPIRDTGTRDLTQNNTQSAQWEYCTTFAPAAGCSTSASTNRTFYPAVYNQYNGGALLNHNNYTKVEIRSTTLTYTGHGRDNRTDCVGRAISTCTYAEEIQNFANWYTYYRSRILASQAGIGEAFGRQGTGLRVGFGAINKTSSSVDGVSTQGVIRGVRSFSGVNREQYFANLYQHVVPTSGTPLRRALDDAGQYFSRNDSAGPWGDVPGTNTGTASQHLQCRQSYTILMTDGYWNGSGASTAAATANVDGTGGPTITGPGSPSFTYSAVSPFSDGQNDTLADVAMYYWKNDLRTDLTNTVPINSLDKAFWQHMTTFGVGLGVTGSINPATAFTAITAIGGTPTITWPDPHTGGNPALLDDLLHASVNSRGGFFSAADPVIFANELSRVLNNIQDRTSSAAAVSSNSTRMYSTTHLYQALFDPTDWTGQLKAFPLSSTGVVGTFVWEASAVLPAHGSRNIKTWNGSAGIDFSGAQGVLTATQVDYLRGDASQEQRNRGSLRNRSGGLGAIINADPHYVKDEDFGYYSLPSTEGSSYSAFVAGKRGSGREAAVYAAANDGGMVHAFRASDGVELFAYVPQTIRDNLAQLTSPAYTHRYFVDGSPTAWDAYLGGAWQTVLVGSLGAGGKAVYALKVNQPNAFGNADVLWEYAGNNTAESNNLGHALGVVTLARFYDGNWWAVFGNGYESANGRSVLFMVRADNPSIVKMIDVGASPSNGMSTPTLLDVNGDRIVDLIYAGDLKGNVWKFDVRSSSSASWGSVYGASPLFQAKDSSGNPQPITAPVEVGLPPTGASGLAVYFGTGQYYAVGDNSTTSTQSMYGIVDRDGVGTSTTGGFSGSNHRTSLVRQTISYEGTVGTSSVKVRALSTNAVNYTGATPDRGWFIDLLTPPYPPGTAKGERIVSTPLLFDGRLLFQTITPSSSPCDFGGSSYFMQVDPASGGNLGSAGFDLNRDGSFTTSDRVPTGGGAMDYASGVDTGVGISGGLGSPIRGVGSAYVPIAGTSGAIGGTSGNEPPCTGPGCTPPCVGPNCPPPPCIGPNCINFNPIKPRATWRQIQ